MPQMWHKFGHNGADRQSSGLASVDVAELAGSTESLGMVSVDEAELAGSTESLGMVSVDVAELAGSTESLGMSQWMKQSWQGAQRV